MASREPLRAVDTAWLRMDRTGSTADVVSVLGFARRLPFGEARRLIEERLLPLPHYRDHIVGEAEAGTAAWEPDAGFSLSHHLEAVKLPPHPEALRHLVGAVATEKTDFAHSPWRMWLADTPEGGSALVTKTHHCMGDGFALMSVLLSMADEPVAFRVPKQRAPSFRDVSLVHGLGSLDLAGAVRAVPRAGREAADLARSLARMTFLPSDPPTVLKRACTGVRHVGWTAPMPLRALRRAAGATGATVNDLLVAAVAGGLRGSLDVVGEAVEKVGVRAMLPVNLRAERPTATDAGAAGNRFGLVYLDMPVDIATPRDRLAAVRERMARLKASPDALVSYGVLGAMGYLPPALHGLASDFFSSKASLVLTNVPGPMKALHLAGRRMGNFVFWVPHPGRLGLGVSILSYAGEVRIGVRADEAVVIDPADMASRIEAEAAALGVEIAPRPAARRRRAVEAETGEQPAQAR